MKPAQPGLEDDDEAIAEEENKIINEVSAFSLTKKTED